YGFVGYPFDYHVTLGFGSIAGGLDHVNLVIRLPLEHGISRVLGKDDYSNSIEFTISVEIPEIFMQQFWYIIKKVKDSESYEFLLANKKCIVNAEVFRKILDIRPRVEGEEFTKVQDNDATLTFIIDLGYKGPLHKYTRLFNKENVDYAELIWEDFIFQIDYRREKKSRRETMPFPRFTKVMINHFLSQHKSLSKLKFQHYHTIKDDGIVSRIKFFRIREDYQEYGLLIPDMMLNDKIKQSDSY
nr:hypothetical protein [Tanacetum cinerariifolium]